MVLGNVPPPSTNLPAKNAGRELRPRSPLNIKRALKSWRSDKSVGGSFLLQPKKSMGSLRLAPYPSNTPSVASQLSTFSTSSAATSPPGTMVVSSKPEKQRKNSLTRSMKTALNSALTQNSSRESVPPSPIAFASPPSHKPSIDIHSLTTRASSVFGSNSSSSSNAMTTRSDETSSSTSSSVRMVGRGGRGSKVRLLAPTPSITDAPPNPDGGTRRSSDGSSNGDSIRVVGRGGLGSRIRAPKNPYPEEVLPPMPPPLPSISEQKQKLHFSGRGGAGSRPPARYLAHASKAERKSKGKGKGTFGQKLGFSASSSSAQHDSTLGYDSASSAGSLRFTPVTPGGDFQPIPPWLRDQAPSADSGAVGPSTSDGPSITFPQHDVFGTANSRMRRGNAKINKLLGSSEFPPNKSNSTLEMEPHQSQLRRTNSTNSHSTSISSFIAPAPIHNGIRVSHQSFSTSTTDDIHRFSLGTEISSTWGRQDDESQVAGQSDRSASPILFSDRAPAEFLAVQDDPYDEDSDGPVVAPSQPQDESTSPVVFSKKAPAQFLANEDESPDVTPDATPSTTHGRSDTISSLPAESLAPSMETTSTSSTGEPNPEGTITIERAWVSPEIDKRLVHTPNSDWTGQWNRKDMREVIQLLRNLR